MFRNFIKIMKIIAVFSIVFMIVFSLVVSQDQYHLDNCHDDHCIVCSIIHIAQNIVNIVVSFGLVVMIGVLIYFYLSRLQKDNKVYLLVSLVFQKVQLNE